MKGMITTQSGESSPVCSSSDTYPGNTRGQASFTVRRFAGLAMLTACFTAIASAAILLLSKQEDATASGVEAPIAVRETPIILWSFRPDHGSATERSPKLPGDLDALRDLLRPVGEMKSVSYMLHFMSFWGLDASAESMHVRGSEISGFDMVRALLDDTSFPWYHRSKPLFYVGGDGILRAARARELDGEAHIDQVLATLGSMGVRASRRIHAVEGDYTIADAVRSSVATFVEAQEVEWSLLAYLHYLPPETRWRNRWGDVFSFDSLAQRLVARPLGEGPCSGTHALAVLESMLHADQAYDIISDATTRAVREYLLHAGHMLARHQHRDGWWTASWASDSPPAGFLTGTIELRVTGHHLEWLLQTPEYARIEPWRIRRAIKWCRMQLAQADVHDVRRNICAYTHATRAAVMAHDESLQN